MYSLPSLPYAYDALEPHFDEEMVTSNHDSHHRRYVNNLNSAVGWYDALELVSVEELIQDLARFSDKMEVVRKNGGGHANHSMFEKGLIPGGSVLCGDLESAIVRDFSSVSAFKERFESAAEARFGSGWVWLLVTSSDRTLAVGSTADQDNPLMRGFVSGVFGYPIMGLNVCEYAYSSQYQDRCADYLAAFWNVVNWDEAARRFDNVR